MGTEMTLIDINDLKLRRRTEEDQTDFGAISLGRSGGDDYWAYRVDLSDKQAVIGFPKHGTIGIDFLHNTGSDLPYSVGLEKLADFMADGRLLGGDEEMPRENVVYAIRMIRDAVVEYSDGSLHCMGACREIQNNIHWGRRDPSDDPTKGLEPHWIEDCTLGSSLLDELDDLNERDSDGWPVAEDEDD